MKGSVRASIRRKMASVLIGTGLLVLLLVGCGRHSTPAPLSPAAVLSDFNSTAVGSQYAYSSVLVTSGHGTRSFVRAFWPRHIGVEMSCRGGRSVTVSVDRRFSSRSAARPG